jgi:hypothetical protein
MFIVLFSIGTLTLVTGLIYRPFRLNQKLIQPRNEIKTNIIVAFVDRLNRLILIRSLIRRLANNRSLLLNRLMNKELELSESSISIEQFYTIKLISVLICTVLVLGVRATNIEQQRKYLVCTSNDGSYEEVIYDEGRYNLYCRISGALPDKIQKDQGVKGQEEAVEYAVSKLLESNDKASCREKADWFLKTQKKVNSIEFINYKHVFIIIGSFFITDIVFLMMWLLRGYSYKREIIKLEYILELLAGIDGIKTSDIVLELQKASKSYQRLLGRFLYIFNSDKRQAFAYLKKSAGNTSMAKLAEVLELYSLTDKTVAMQILERAAMERDEAAVITADETLDIVDLIAFASVVPLIYEIAHLMLSPMLDMIYRAFQYV